jgi:hypothetical protein
MFAAHLLSTILMTAPVQTDCLFILAHAGETNDLLPVMEEMQRQKRDFRILPLGVSEELVKTRLNSVHILRAEEYGIVIGKDWPNDRELPKETVEAAAARIHAKVVITGVPLLPQKQFLEAYRGRAKTFAYWDCPEPRGGILYFNVALQVQAQAEKVLFPSSFVANAKEFASRADNERVVVGKPTLLPYVKGFQVDRQNVLQKLGFSEDRPIITFIGTYGERYERAFELFVESIKGQKVNSQVIFQIHPMASGEFEAKCCQRVLGDQFSYVISPKDKERGISLFDALAVADKVVTYNSSGGFQAMLGNKPVFYVVPDQDGYSNSLIEQGLASKASTKKEIEQLLTIPAKKSSADSLIYSMGIPLNPVERFLESIQEF